jgi:hypothetical protein
MWQAVVIAAAVLFFVIQALIVHYLIKLESIGCKCAMDWRRQYIIFYFVISILYMLSAFFIKRESIPILQTLMVVLGLANVVFTLQYVNKLKKEKCECSESIYRDVLGIVSIFNAVIYSMLLTYIIFFLFTVLSFVSSANKKLEISKRSISVKPLTPIKRR